MRKRQIESMNLKLSLVFYSIAYITCSYAVDSSQQNGKEHYFLWVHKILLIVDLQNKFEYINVIYLWTVYNWI